MVRQKTPAESAQDWTLTEEQATAVDLLATGRTIGETAEALEMPVQTVHEWCRSHPGVQAELNTRRQELWTGTADRLRALLPKALEVLAEELQGENRLHAAVWTCSHDTGHIWEEILPHPSESMSRTLKDLERQACTVFWEMIRLSH